MKALLNSMKTTKISDLDLVERLKLEEEFFNSSFMMSYSGLSKLNYSPGAFYQHYVLKQRDDVVDKGMAEGSLIHCMILNPEMFDEQFVLLPDVFPSDNPKRVLDRLKTHIAEAYPEVVDIHTMMPLMTKTNISNAVLDILKDENLYQSLKTDAQRIDKIFTDKNLEYLDYLIKSKNKMVVDRAMVEFARNVREKVMAEHHIRELMGFNENPHHKVYNEMMLANFSDDYTFGLRGIMDNIVIDHARQVIRINDLKKTAKAASMFKDAIEYYQYWLQVGMYKLIVDSLKNEMLQVDYPVEFRFIVIDPYMHVVPYLISSTTMNMYVDMTKDCLHIADYHFKARDFSAPMSVLTSENKEIIL